MYARILVAIDGSSTSDRALQEAIALAKDQKAELRLVHVVDRAPLAPDYIELVDESEIDKIFTEAGQKVVADGLAQTKAAGITATSTLLQTVAERVANVIIDEAKHWPADLIIVGTHGRHGIGHFFLGSVAEGVSRNAAMPVLLIRSQ